MADPQKYNIEVPLLNGVDRAARKYDIESMARIAGQAGYELVMRDGRGYYLATVPLTKQQSADILLGTRSAFSIGYQIQREGSTHENELQCLGTRCGYGLLPFRILPYGPT